MNLFFYIVTVLIWGSTWLAIKFQLGDVHPTWSVAYRFGISAGILILFCLLTRRSLKFNRREHMAMALQGLLLFSLNYILYYFGSRYFASGLVAIVFATIIIMNILNARIFFGSPLAPRVIYGAIIGLLGLSVVFSSQFETLNLSTSEEILRFLEGLGICVTATLLASLGNMASVKSQKLKLPILESNAIGMAYGTLFVTIIALFTGEKPTWDDSFAYLSSLFYLAIFGSILAFGSYLKLIGRIGPERAAYAFVVTPVVALILSTLFENFQWTLITFLGSTLVIIGNVLVLTKKRV